VVTILKHTILNHSFPRRNITNTSTADIIAELARRNKEIFEYTHIRLPLTKSEGGPVFLKRSIQQEDKLPGCI
jgi:hypothetical protein